MERYPQHRVISIVKCPVAGYVVQPFVIDVRLNVVLAQYVLLVKRTLTEFDDLHRNLVSRLQWKSKSQASIRKALICTTIF